MPPYFAWQALHGQGWPASSEQEQVLVETLRRAAGSNRSSDAPEHDDLPRRTVVTALLNALRCGVEYDELKRSLPALDPAEVLAAHAYLADGIAEATSRWRHLLADPTTDALLELGPQAALLLPVPVHRIEVLLNNVVDPHRIRQSVDRVSREVVRISTAATSIERRLETRSPGSRTGLRLGRSLHDVAEPGVWTHPYFLPTRVGQLSSTRVRDLYQWGVDRAEQ